MIHDPALSRQQIDTIEAYDRTAEEFQATIARLDNYHSTYDALAKRLSPGDTVLDLACGPAQISRYLCQQKQLKIVGVDLAEGMLEIARKNIHEGLFHSASIIDFHLGGPYDGVVLGFGIPYLDEVQTEACLNNAAWLLKPGKALYLSFMHGRGSRTETTSFGGEHPFLIYYHDSDTIREILKCSRLEMVDEFELDYREPDGSITRDMVFIAKKTEEKR